MMQTKPGKGRRQLVLMAVLFSLPPLLAWTAWQYMGNYGVNATNNAGTLVRPARPLELAYLQDIQGNNEPFSQLKGHWFYVVFAPKTCDELCQQQLFLTRQTRIGVNKDIQRVKRLLVLGHQPSAEFLAKLKEQQVDLLLAVAEDPASAWYGAFQGEGFNTTGQQFFLVDPLGNLMMFYTQDVTAKGILRDLQKLLKVSQIG
jgi:cytochrome oxidase Cu insertion factor (SCO1/SenC/PrrC family)